jgi:hypothetical protein
MSYRFEYLLALKALDESPFVIASARDSLGRSCFLIGQATHISRKLNLNLTRSLSEHEAHVSFKVKVLRCFTNSGVGSRAAHGCPSHETIEIR